MQNNKYTIDRLLEIMATLRDPVSGCKWDLKQDFSTIAPHTLEEAYEVFDAVQNNDMVSLKEELGDLLLQVVFHAQMAKEQQFFDFDEVVAILCDKLITRHEHIFINKSERSAEQQEQAWELQKQKERDIKQQQDTDGVVLAGVAKALPALLRACKLQKRASGVGFDWPDNTGVIMKIEEELDEVKAAMNGDGNVDEEIGDLLFAVVNLARKQNIDPEASLRSANKKFTKRFTYIENQLKQQGLEFSDVDLAKMDEIWEQAKAQ